jgi:hypothetical protein
VDIYDPKAGDSWESISREFYYDARYAPGLREYNHNKKLTGEGSIDVPPLHVVKQKMPAAAPAGRGTNSGNANQGSKGTGSPPAWNAAPAPVTRTGNVTKFTVPQGGGMTMRGIARTMLGNEQRWKDIYDLNPDLKPDDMLPAGTELKLPPDARNPG